MEQTVESILAWISANPHWAGLAVFAIAFLESLAIVGLAVPGWLLLVGVGSLIGAGHLNFWLISLASFSGAVLGQLVSYGVGYHFNDRIHQWSWVKNHQSLMERAELFFKKHGFAGILVGQFIGPIRAVISLVAGVLTMPIKKFITAVVLATMIWAPVYLMPGVLVGAALTFEQTQMWLLLSSIVLMGVSLWLISRYAFDAYKVKNTNQNLPQRRHVMFILMMIVFSTTVIFLVVSDYGTLMLDLMTKIWGLVS
ncbi:DedA family protein [Kangiella sp. HZ709]|uniref:DedA family protein n=1 Tax=Kangiella sp. HZ709 TaxID=2666328 RepID=UPI0012AF39B8|nr:DedA family protein [Kangiella sp. HZ709]MRX27703.1 DedA family protein [Kangiella sp. HZ709]